MGKITSFTFISLDGYYTDKESHIEWNTHEQEDTKFSEENLKKESILLFGRKTYEMMASFWPEKMAADMFPKVAKGMNQAEKWVISRSLKQANWNGTRIIHEKWEDEIKNIKNTSDKNITLLGSGNILAQLTELRLIDEYQIMIVPVILGEGKSWTQGVTRLIPLSLKEHTLLKNGKMILTYTPR